MPTPRAAAEFDLGFQAYLLLRSLGDYSPAVRTRFLHGNKVNEKFECDDYGQMTKD
jgi:hypothetical protein